MSVLWKKILEDGTQACRMDDGSFIFCKNTTKTDNYYAFLKLQVPEELFDSKDLYAEVDFEICEFDALDRERINGHLLSKSSINSLVIFVKNNFNFELPQEIIDDLEATRLARRMTDGE